MKRYEVKQKIRGVNIKGGVLHVGDIITRDDMPGAKGAKFDHLVKDGWLVEVKDDGEIQTEQ